MVRVAMDPIFYVYLHHRPDGQVFYVGKGHARRAWSKRARNQHWRAIVQKHGYTVSLAAQRLTEEEALAEERRLIAHYRTLGKMANICDGGQTWPKGQKRPPEFGRAVSAARAGIRQSPEHVEKNRAAHLGLKHSPATIEKMRRQRARGAHNNRPIEVCGELFQSMTAFARFVGVTPLAVKKWVDQGKKERMERAYKEVSCAA